MKKVLIFCLAFLLVGFSLPSEAFQKYFIIEESGSFIAEGTPIDTNNDGRKADLVMTSGKGPMLGQTSTQSVIEWGRFDSVNDCENRIGSSLVYGSSVIHTVKGLIFAEFDKGKNCVNLKDSSGVLSAEVSLEGDIIGGTEFFQGAQGTISVTGTVYPVLITPGLDVKFGGVELKGMVIWNFPK